MFFLQRIKFFFGKDTLSAVRFLAAELVIVVLGILIAFQVENWRESRAEREAEAVALAGLASDLSADLDLIARFVERSERRAAAMDGLLMSLQSGMVEAPEVLAERWLEVVFGLSFNLNTATYAGLKDGSRLHIIRDEELRAGLIVYYERTVPFLLGRADRIRIARDDFVEHSQPWIYRSSIDKPFPGRVIAIAEVLHGEPWYFSVAEQREEMARDEALDVSANELSGFLSAFRIRSADAVIQLNDLIANIAEQH